jgi:stearoyl-CoA desaturase (delta-9 desaturase)
VTQRIGIRAVGLIFEYAVVVERVSEPPTPMDVVSRLLLVGMHLACLLAFVAPLTPHAIALALGGYVVRMWGVTAGYHRYFSHRSFKTSRAFQLALAVLGATAMQNGPLWWASWHRMHHKHADSPRDIHSPLQYGFWHAHIGWILSRRQPDLSNVKDLRRHPELCWVDRHKWVPLIGYATLCLAIGGWSGLIWGFFVSTVAVFHATLSINSLAHVWGTQSHPTADGSRNNLLLALLTLGEGWHNNHHYDSSRARQGTRWWQLDVTYYSLVLLARVGLVWDLRGAAPSKPRNAAHVARGTSTSDTRGR